MYLMTFPLSGTGCLAPSTGFLAVTVFFSCCLTFSSVDWYIAAPPTSSAAMSAGKTVSAPLVLFSHSEKS